MTQRIPRAKPRLICSPALRDGEEYGPTAKTQNARIDLHIARTRLADQPFGRNFLEDLPVGRELFTISDQGIAERERRYGCVNIRWRWRAFGCSRGEGYRSRDEISLTRAMALPKGVRRAGVVRKCAPQRCGHNPIIELAAPQEKVELKRLVGRTLDEYYRTAITHDAEDGRRWSRSGTHGTTSRCG